MVCAIERIRFYLFVFNLFYSLYGVGLLILGILASNAYLDKFPDQEDDVGSIGIGIIIFGASVLAITVVGYCGTSKKSYYTVLTYSVLLLATLIFKVVLLYLAFRIYDDMINYDVKRTNDDFKLYLPNYWTKEIARDNVDFDQSKYYCCGSTGPSDFNRLSENEIIPWSCCGSDKNVACNITTAYQIGCPIAYTNLIRVTYKSASWVFGLLSAGLAVAVLVAAYCAIHLANTIKNARREYNV